MNVLHDKKNTKIDIKIEEVKKINLSARILATSVALQMERNVPFKRAMKKVMGDAMREGGKGIKVKVSGRLGGSEMARVEWYSEGRIPNQTLRAEIDYGTAEALTKYGLIGVKVWLYKGDILGKKSLFEESGMNDNRDKKPFTGKKKPNQPEKKEDLSIKKKRTKKTAE